LLKLKILFFLSTSEYLLHACASWRRSQLLLKEWRFLQNVEKKVCHGIMKNVYSVWFF
jgi:hypothetical protein